MIELPPEKPYVCMYCNATVKKAARGKRGEHVIPEAIGGGFTLNQVCERRVCERCNSGVLSNVDRELCSRSFLSMVASQIRGKPLWQAWDVDHQANNLLVEASPDWNADGTLKNLTCYPQLVFDRPRIVTRGDAEQAEMFGHRNFANLLIRAAKNAYGRFRETGKGIRFEEIYSNVVRSGYRMPARLFTPRTIFELANDVDKATFVLRFVDPNDRKPALDKIPEIIPHDGRSHWKQQLGSHAPALSFYFDIGMTIRGLIKIGFNLVAALCERTDVGRSNFPEAVHIIQTGFTPTRRHLSTIGYVHPESLMSLHRDDPSHVFQVVHHQMAWHVYSSFFGGRVCSYVNFPGPSNEDWTTATVVAALDSDEWKPHKSNLTQLIPCKVAGQRGENVVPSMKLHNAVSTLQVTAIPRRLQRTR